ncbi:MAG: class I SAM-dependent methyltransferase [Acidobacteria bacterium]|nr:class I SAM-dependent methyltransferase [Acidobacteriota bacterium]
MTRATAAAAGPRREDADVETSSDGYARRFAGSVGGFFLDVQARITLELLAQWPKASVLDVGGGHGQLTGPLVETGFDVTVYGSDEACRARVGSWVDAGRARFRAGDLLVLPWPDRAFDLVLSYRLLPHVSRWRELLAELARVARVAVVVDYPTRRSVNVVADALFGVKKGVEGNTRPFTVFGDGEIEEAFEAAGLRVTARRPEFFFPMALHRAVGAAPLARALEGAARALGLTRALGSPVILCAERRP